MKSFSRNSSHHACLLGGSLACLFLSMLAPAALAEYPTNDYIADFLSMNCTGCHDGSTSEGDLDLESLSMELSDPDNFHLWEPVFDRVREGEMPPDETLDEEELSPFLASLQDTLKKADSARVATKGRVPARKLTRAQYERNVCELLAINIPFDGYLPADSLSDGFDTVSKGQQISTHTMAAYLNAADAALDAAFNQIQEDSPPSKVWLDWKQLRRDELKTGRMTAGRAEHEDIVSWSTRQNFYGKLTATTVPTADRYRIRLSVQAVHPPSDGRVWCSVQSGFINAKASTMFWVGSFEATSEEKEYEFEAWIRDGHMLRIVPNDCGLRQVPVPLIGKPAGTIEPMGFPGVAIKWIEMERIVPDRFEAQRALIGDLRLRKIAAAETRHPSLVLSSDGTTSTSHTANGSMIPPENSPQRLFAQLFTDDSPESRIAQKQRIREGRSIMDIVGEEAKAMQRRLGPGDRDKLTESSRDITNSVTMVATIKRSRSLPSSKKPKCDPGATSSADSMKPKRRTAHCSTVRCSC